MEIFRPGTVGPGTGLGLKTEPGRYMLQKLLQSVQPAAWTAARRPAGRERDCSRRVQSGPTAGPLMQSFPLGFCFLLCLRLLCWFYMAFRCGPAHGRVKWVGEMNFWTISELNFKETIECGAERTYSIAIAQVDFRDYFLFPHCALLWHPSNRAGDVTSHTETWTTQIGVGCHGILWDKKKVYERRFVKFIPGSFFIFQSRKLTSPSPSPCSESEPQNHLLHGSKSCRIQDNNYKIPVLNSNIWSCTARARSRVQKIHCRICTIFG